MGAAVRLAHSLLVMSLESDESPRRRRRRAGTETEPAEDTVADRQDDARSAGQAAFSAIRLTLARRAAEMIRSDPDDAATALEMGLVDRAWLEHPGERPISSTTPAEIVERFLERSIERKPSRLSSLGLTALQVLCAPSGDPDNGVLQRLAVVFTDLEGFTSYTDANGDGAALELLAEHYRAAGPMVRSWSGKIVKRLGDGLLCTFPDAESGVRAALELLDSAPSPLRLRAGMHFGEALVSRHDVVGQVVNVAARVAESAKGGEVAITEEAAMAAGEIPGARLGRPRARRFKGLSDPIRVRIVTRQA